MWEDVDSAKPTRVRQWIGADKVMIWIYFSCSRIRNLVILPPRETSISEFLLKVLIDFHKDQVQNRLKNRSKETFLHLDNVIPDQVPRDSDRLGTTKFLHLPTAWILHPVISRYSERWNEDRQNVRLVIQLKWWWQWASFSVRFLLMTLFQHSTKGNMDHADASIEGRMSLNWGILIARSCLRAKSLSRECIFDTPIFRCESKFDSDRNGRKIFIGSRTTIASWISMLTMFWGIRSVMLMN
jgi:hypothetical protein